MDDSTNKNIQDNAQFSEELFSRLKEQGVESQIRLLTSEDELVCEICSSADHKLKDQKIYTAKGGWNGQTWGQRFGNPPFHDGCRCQTIVEKNNTLQEESESDYLDSIGKNLEAAEIRYKMALRLFGKYPTIAISHASDFAKIGARKRAWEIFTEGLQFAANNKESPHQIRGAMADLLFSEGKLKEATGFLLLGIEEAEKFYPQGTPKFLLISLKKTIKLLGVKEKTKFEEIITMCKSHGAKKSFELLNSFLSVK